MAEFLDIQDWLKSKWIDGSLNAIVEKTTSDQSVLWHLELNI